MENSSGTEYTIVRSGRSTVQIVISGGAVIVRAPMQTPVSAIDAFVKEKRDWILRKLREQIAKLDEANDLESAGEVLLFGVRTVPIVNGKRAKTVTEIKKFYADRLGYLETRVRDVANAFGFSYGKLGFSNARSRWGTCDADNNIRLNWRLLAVPKEIIDYVIVHELAHTVRHDHSSKFWAVVAGCLPDWKKRRKALGTYSWLGDKYR